MRGGGKAPLPPPPQYPNAVLDLLNNYAILNVTGFIFNPTPTHIEHPTYFTGVSVL